ncbi:VP39 [Urbanus proteus nucleopolyhedrovirus]|uniref:VP39 n=1 Tax=Urbanus proteus nucleopolyhedrovirus TaxID=1675866 RepID=A0A161C6Y7_9ABAC|nr:VP39 [Urbanus proteus nucleopolyhedrovirus]AKR17372.1 VP39 [Urbanus proteus nucleopolyhedrovirus]
MALLPLGVSSTRLKNYCVYGAIQPFDSCRVYGTPCSPDANINDKWFICEYHCSIRFKIEKMVMPIPDAEGTVYNRTVGRSLVNHKTEGDNRILIPTRYNYETVLNVRAMPLAEQLVTHMIYENKPEQDRICQLLQYNENFETNMYPIVENIYSKTIAILSMTDNTRYCSQVQTNDTRIFADQTSNAVFVNMPKFLQNLILRCVAPEILRIDEEELLLRNCATCNLYEDGLRADVNLYNPVVPKYRSGYNDSVLQVESVLKFRGNSNALQTNLARYEEYPIVVPLISGNQILSTATVRNTNAFTLPTIISGTSTSVFPPPQPNTAAFENINVAAAPETLAATVQT